MLVNGAPIYWQSKRQTLTSQSTAEAEYIARASTLQHGAHVIRMLQPLLPDLAHNPQLLVDNQPSNDMVNTLTGTKRRKFIDLRHAYIRGTLERQAI